LSRRSLILEVRELCRQGDPLPVETVLARHAEATQFESLIFDLIHEEYHQRDQNGIASDPTEFKQRFSKWGIDFAEFLEARNLLENYRDSLIDDEDAAWPECLGTFQLLGELGRGTFAQVY